MLQEIEKNKNKKFIAKATQVKGLNLLQPINNIKGESYTSEPLAGSAIIQALANSPTIATVENVLKQWLEVTKPLTLQAELYAVLTTTLEADKGLTKEQALSLAKLSWKVANNNIIEFSPEEIVKIHERVLQVETNKVLAIIINFMVEGKNPQEELNK